MKVLFGPRQEGNKIPWQPHRCESGWEGIWWSENRQLIVEELLARTYQPQPVKTYEIPKAKGGTRVLEIPIILDRVIQQAIVQVLTPIFDR